MLYATRESGALVGPILGVAGLHSLKTYGELPVGSHNLHVIAFDTAAAGFRLGADSRRSNPELRKLDPQLRNSGRLGYAI
jgi:hypothetical protein